MLVLIYHSREFLHTARSLWTRFKSIFECHQYIHVPHLGIWSQIWSINSLNFHLKSFRLIFSPDFNSWKKKKKNYDDFTFNFVSFHVNFTFLKKKCHFHISKTFITSVLNKVIFSTIDESFDDYDSCSMNCSIYAEKEMLLKCAHYLQNSLKIQWKFLHDYKRFFLVCWAGKNRYIQCI